MYGTGNKKMLNMLILDILKDYSDTEHRLTQQDIIKTLELNYGMKCDRRSVKNNILSLKEMGYDISVENGYFLIEREFEDSELRMLIDSVLFSKTISRKQAKTIIDKLRKMSNKYFSAKVSHVSNLPELYHGDNKQVMYTLDLLNDAISIRKKISFMYNSYGVDFKLHPKRAERYIINPYQMVANNGHYYLIGNYDKYDDISHYRIDRITDAILLEECVKPMQKVKGIENGLSLPKHMAEHIYMFSGESVNVKMYAKKHLMNELVDWFGKDFKIRETNQEEQIEIIVICNEEAMFYWALQYGPYVEVLEPIKLRERIAKEVIEMCVKYKEILGEENDE